MGSFSDHDFCTSLVDFNRLNQTQMMMNLQLQKLDKENLELRDIVNKLLDGQEMLTPKFGNLDKKIDNMSNIILDIDRRTLIVEDELRQKNLGNHLKNCSREMSTFSSDSIECRDVQDSSDCDLKLSKEISERLLTLRKPKLSRYNNEDTATSNDLKFDSLFKSNCNPNKDGHIVTSGELGDINEVFPESKSDDFKRGTYVYSRSISGKNISSLEKLDSSEIRVEKQRVEIFRLKRFLSISEDFHHAPPEEKFNSKLCFTVSSPVTIHGVGLYCCYLSGMKAQVQLSREGNKIIACSPALQEISQRNSKSDVVALMFNKPVKLEPCTLYRVCAAFRGGKFRKGAQEKQSAVFSDPENSKRSLFKFTSYEGVEGQIPILFLSHCQ